MTVLGRPGRIIVYLVALYFLRLHANLWHAEALSIPRHVRAIGELSRGILCHPDHPYPKTDALQPPPVSPDRNHEAILAENLPPTPVTPDSADTTQPSKRQVVISGPTSTVTAGSGAGGVQINTGNGDNGGTGNAGTSSGGGSGGGLTTDQKLQIGLGVGIGLPGAIAGLIAIWAALKGCCKGR